VHAPRRDTVRYDRSSHLLTVGEHTAVLEPSADGDGNEAILRTYLELVARARHVVLGSGMQLRNDDIQALAALLHEDDVDLDRRLSRMLGVSLPEATEVRARISRHRLLIGAASLAVGLLAAAPFVGGGTDPAAATAAATVTPAPGVDIGTAMVIERGTQPADPNTQIGDTITYER
jgi:hypothetical protein